MGNSTTRRSFMKAVGLGAAATGLSGAAHSQKRPAQGSGRDASDPDESKVWKPVSDRKIRVGLVGYGVSRFAAAFSFQHHPNVEVVAVSDLIPERCTGLARAEAACGYSPGAKHDGSRHRRPPVGPERRHPHEHTAVSTLKEGQSKSV